MKGVDDELISEDETDMDHSRPGMKVFRRVEKGWVNPKLTRLFHGVLDQHLHELNIFGEFSAGNQFRQRINHPPARVSWTGVVVGLPINYYNPDWLDELSPEQHAELKCKPRVDFDHFLPQLRQCASQAMRQLQCITLTSSVGNAASGDHSAA